MTATDTTATQPTCTPEQIAEWDELHDRIAILDAEHQKAEREAGSWLTWGITRNDTDFAHGKALEDAQRAVDLWAERTRLYEEVQAHPYTAVVTARTAARAAA